jgi:protein-tyrosine phosphatase
MPSVLFLCSANRFRSPLAAGIFQKALAEEERQRTSAWGIGRADDWQVTSAGLQAAPRQPVLPDVLDAAAQLGIDLSDHWSERASDLDLRDFDLIIVMQASQLAQLHGQYPQLQERIYLFSQVVDNEYYDIPDDYNSPQGVMGVCVVMNDLIRRRLSYICVLAIALHNKREFA